MHMHAFPSRHGTPHVPLRCLTPQRAKQRPPGPAPVHQTPRTPPIIGGDGGCHARLRREGSTRRRRFAAAVVSHIPRAPSQGPLPVLHRPRVTARAGGSSNVATTGRCQRGTRMGGGPGGGDWWGGDVECGDDRRRRGGGVGLLHDDRGRPDVGPRVPVQLRTGDQGPSGPEWKTHVAHSSKSQTWRICHGSHVAQSAKNTTGLEDVLTVRTWCPRAKPQDRQTTPIARAPDDETRGWPPPEAP